MPGQPHQTEIPPEIEVEITPAVKAFVVSLIESIRSLTLESETLTQQSESLTDQVQTLVKQSETLTMQSQASVDQVQELSEKSTKSTPRNCSLPPSTEHVY